MSEIYRGKRNLRRMSLLDSRHGNGLGGTVVHSPDGSVVNRHTEVYIAETKDIARRLAHSEFEHQRLLALV